MHKVEVFAQATEMLLCILFEFISKLVEQDIHTLVCQANFVDHAKKSKEYYENKYHMKDRKYLHFANLENSHIAYLCLYLLFIKPELVLCKLCQRHLLREIGDCKPLKQGLLV